MSKPRPTTAKPLSVLLSDVFSDAYAKQGFAARELVTRWSDIAGPEVAAHSEPLKIQWPRPVDGQPQEPATLVLRAERPMALAIQHASDVILPRAGPEGGRQGRRTPVLGRGRGPAGGAGAAGRRHQAKLSRRKAAGIAACHCHTCRYKLANTPLGGSLGAHAPIWEFAFDHPAP